VISAAGGDPPRAGGDPRARKEPVPPVKGSAGYHGQP
jgi:hypothetical protein